MTTIALLVGLAVILTMAGLMIALLLAAAIASFATRKRRLIP